MKTFLVLWLVLSLGGCATIHRHPTATKIVIVSGGLIAAGVYAAVSRQHCEHYPPGYSGVGVNCPKPDATPEKQ